MGRRNDRVFRVVNHVMAVLFLISAVLQYNDPDPFSWILIWAGAAVACWVHARAARGWLVAAAVGAAAIVWAVSLAPATLPDLELGDLAKRMKAETPQIELGREMLGLVIIAAWMAVLVFVGVRARTPRDG